MIYSEIQRRLETLANVEDWNREKAEKSKGAEKERFLDNADKVSNERQDLMDSLSFIHS